MIVVDIETTGLDPRKHSIVSIGALDFTSPLNQFYQECRIFKGAEVMEEALQINGFSKEEIKDPDKKSLKETIEDFFVWVKKIKERTIAGSNPSFDRDFLMVSAERFNLPWFLGHRTIDLHALGYSHFLQRGLTPPVKEGRTDLNTDGVLSYVGLPEEPKPHHALTGTKMEAEAFSRLIYGRSLLSEFKNYPLPDYLLKP
jgi:DNA polymerase III epsilon subunit-like protein